MSLFDGGTENAWYDGLPFGWLRRTGVTAGTQQFWFDGLPEVGLLANEVLAAALLTGTGTLDAAGTRIRGGAASLTGTGSLNATAVRTVVASANLSGSGVLVADGSVASAVAPVTGGGGGKRRRQQVQAVGRPVAVAPKPARVLVVASRPRVTVGLTTVSPSIGGRATAPAVCLRLAAPTPKPDEYIDAVVRRVPIDLDLPILLAA